ncbi:MAG TPA: recombinase RecT [Chitinispirillaceae bacterium]|nr:recombinase RecT [Chitinispirillaceae bacterium]
MATNSANKILSMIDVAGSKERFNKYKETVEKMLPKSTDSDRYWAMYARIAQEFISNPKITDKKSILTCMFNAAKLNLNPDPIFGEIYFVPYKGTLTNQIGYKGMIKLSINSGLITDVRMGLVHEKDEWDFYENETGQHYYFKPNLLEGKNRGRELFGYSVFQKKDGSCSCHIMESYHIDEIKKMVLARTPKSPWADSLFEPEMRKKTVLRRHWKTQPKSAEIAYAIEAEESLERGEILKTQHPELEGIIDDLVEKAESENNNNDEYEIQPGDLPFDKEPDIFNK